MKFDEKYAALKDKPAGIARRMTSTEDDKSDAKIARKRLREVHAHPEKLVTLEQVKAEMAALEPNRAEKIETRTQKITKTEKVKAWRAANPELYAAQKRRTAEAQAKKRAEKEQPNG